MIPKVEQYSDENGHITWHWYCPGCESLHIFMTGKGSPSWTFNGDIEKPTIKPSIKTTYPPKGICHVFIKNGIIEYLSDCYHDLKNKFIPMVNINTWQD